MTTRTKTLIGIGLLGFADAVIPGLPLLALMLIYVVLEKPAWFSGLYRDIYASNGSD